MLNSVENLNPAAFLSRISLVLTTIARTPRERTKSILRHDRALVFSRAAPNSVYCKDELTLRAKLKSKTRSGVVIGLDPRDWSRSFFNAIIVERLGSGGRTRFKQN